jgi:hypothetical protein
VPDFDLLSGFIESFRFFFERTTLETVSFIRYQKSFGLAELPKLSPGDTLGTLGKHAERTVMIMNATAFPAWLRKLGMWGNHGWTFSM